MSRSTTSVSESSRVFVGGLGVGLLAWAYWHGYLFLPIAEPVAVAIAGPDDGKLGSGEFADLLAKMLTGALWAIGELIWIALTVGYRFTRFLGVAIVKWLLSFTEAGREFIGHWQDDDAVATAAETVGATSDQATSDRVERHAARLTKAIEACNAMMSSLNHLIKRSNAQKATIASMQETIESLKQAKSFSAWQKSLAPETDE